MDIQKIIRESARATRGNLQLILPTALGSVLATALAPAMMEMPENPQTIEDFDQKALLIWSMLSIVIIIFTHGVTLAMARQVRQDGQTSLWAGMYLGARFAFPFLTVSAMIVVTVFAGLLMMVIPGFMALPFMIYALPGIVVSGADPLEAYRGSFRLAITNLRETFTLFLFLTIGFLAANFAGLALSAIPMVGPVAGLLLNGAFWALASMTVLMAYVELKGAGARTDTPEPPPQ